MGKKNSLVVGNWKMNGLMASLVEVGAIVKGAAGVTAELAICPPATLAGMVRGALEGSAVCLGGQDCHSEPSGAFTGDVSAEMWADLGARYVIVGHSERRQGHGESDATVAAKAAGVLRAGLIPIICVGESLAEREAGCTLTVIAAQLAGSLPGERAGVTRAVIAYEPVWAIGTGRTPTIEQVAEVHQAIGLALEKRFGEAGGQIRLLYGGSVKPDNAAEILAISGVDGALVGGASLRASDFLMIAKAAG